MDRRLPGSGCDPAQQPNGVDGVRLLRRLVGTIAEHPGESQRDAARVAGAALDSVEGDLDNEVRLAPPQPVVPLDGSGEELLGLPGQQLVGQTLEGLAE